MSKLAMSTMALAVGGTWTLAQKVVRQAAVQWDAELAQVAQAEAACTHGL